MKPDLRWQLLLAVVGFALVLGLLSIQAQFESPDLPVCVERVPAAGGTFNEGIVGAPRFLNPLLSDNNPVDRELVSLIFDGLTRLEDGKLVPALAESWSVSEDGLTVSFTLRDNLRWHDGEPVTTADVAFTYGLLQDEEFAGSAGLKRLWQSVTIEPVSETEINFILQEPYAAFVEATARGILPAHLLQDITAATLPDAPFNREPVGTGLSQVVPGQDWQVERSLRLIPSSDYFSGDMRLDELAFRFYPDEQAVLAAFEAGEVQAINSVSPVMLPNVTRLPEARLFSNVAPRYTSLLFNLSDSGAPAVRSVDVRRALAIATDRQALVDDVLNGQGVLLDGPYLPTSWAYGAGLVTRYAPDAKAAAAALDAAGWTLAEGETVRSQEGQLLSPRLLVWGTPTNQALAEALVTQWAQVGIAPQLLLVSDWNEFRQELALRNFDVALVDVTPPSDPDLYDFWSQEAIVRGQNYAAWNRRRASEALESGRQIWAVEERRPFYEAFLRLYNEDLPELVLFQHVYTYAVSESVNAVEIGRIDHPRDRYTTLVDWYIGFDEVQVACTTP